MTWLQLPWSGTLSAARTCTQLTKQVLKFSSKRSLIFSSVFLSEIIWVSAEGRLRTNGAAEVARITALRLAFNKERIVCLEFFKCLVNRTEGVTIFPQGVGAGER